MPRLFVTAIGEDTISAPDNAQSTYIVASVEDTNGAPVTGLTVPNFKLGTEIVGPGGSLSHIQSVTNGNIPGTYLLKILPLAGQTWKQGVYISSLAVARGADKGQTLCSFMMD